MRKILLNIFILLVVCTNIMAQNNKVISIIYFDNVDNVSQKILELKSKFSKSKNKYQFELINFFNKDKRALNDQNSFNSNKKPIINYDFNDVSALSQKIDELTNSNSIVYNEDFLTNFSSEHNHRNLDELYKKIKKLKSENIIIYWFNGFVPYYKSKENLSNTFEALKKTNQVNKIIPQVITPEVDMVLKPTAKYYIMEFEGIDYFENYEIEITKTNDNRLLIKNMIQVTEDGESEDYYLFKTGYGEKLKLKLKQDYLGYECIKNYTNEIPDSTCNCRFECLYDREFSIRIRGVKEDFYRDELWSNKIGPFLFQCNNTNGKKD
jgi:hypothetical protein